MLARLRIETVLCIAAALLVVRAEGAAELNRHEGRFASAAMVVLDETGCVESTLRVSAADERTRSHTDGAASSLLLFLTLFKHDVCSNITLFQSSALLDMGPDELAFAANGGGARLETSLELVDDGSGETLPLSLDLTWIADDDPLTSFMERRRSTGGGFRHVVSQDRFAFSNATVAGSATDGEVEYMTGELSDVFVIDSRESDLMLPGATVLQALRTARAHALRGKPHDTQVSLESSVSAWERFDDSGCVRNTGLVLFSDQESTDEPTPVRTAFVEFASFDHCSDTALFWVRTDALIPVEDGAFTISRDLESAELDAALPGLDRVSGNPVTLTVELRLDGNGEVSAEDSRQKVTEQGVTTDIRHSQTVRNAAVSGTVSDGTSNLLEGFPVAPGDLLFSTLGIDHTWIKVR